MHPYQIKQNLPSTEGYNAAAIKNIFLNLREIYGTDKIYAMGRAAEVIRGLFPSTHVVQFYLADETAAQTELLRSKSIGWYVMGAGLPHPQHRLAGFGRFHPFKNCVIYPQSVLLDARSAEFIYQIEKEGKAWDGENVPILSFALNLAFWKNNNFFHEETTVVMESVNDYLQSSIGNEKDIPLIGAMHRFLAMPKGNRTIETFMNISERLLKHEHGELLSRVFKETVEETA